MTPPRLSGHALRCLARALGSPRALLGGALDARLRERIILRVSSVNRCPVCAGVHGVVGRAAGLAPAEIGAACRADLGDDDERTRAALRYAELRTEDRERDAPADVERFEELFSTREQAAVRAVVDLFTFANRFNNSWLAALRLRRAP